MLTKYISYRTITRISNFRLSGFDVAAKLRDSSTVTSDPEISKKRKPSDRVLRLADDILNLSLVEAADLCDLCSERLGGSKPGFFPMMPGSFQMPMSTAPVAAAPVAAPAVAVAAPVTPVAPAAAAKSTVSIKLVSFDAGKKVQTVKEVRAMTALGLKEAKDAVEAAPKILKKGVPIEEANVWKKKLQDECGAVVELE